MKAFIDRYIFREMLPPFLINMGFFTFVFLMSRILEITRLIVNFKVGLGGVLLLLLYSMPFFLEFIIPMSVMMAVLLVFLRLSADNEITALKAGGVSLYRLIPPVLAFCVMGTVLTLGITLYGLPWGKRSFNDLAIRLAESNVDAGLKARTFNDAFEGVMLYVNRIDPQTRTLMDVFIEEQNTQGVASTIIAPRGRLLAAPKQHFFQLRLFDGLINQVSLKSKSAHTLRFDRYDLKLDLKAALASAISKRKAVEEMSLTELYTYVKQLPEKDTAYYTGLLKLHEKFSIPFACLALGLLAFPLGIRSKTDRRSQGIVLGLVLFLLYYLMFSVGWSFGESGAYPPPAGMWIPNLVMSVLGIFFIRRAARDLPLVFPVFGRRNKKTAPPPEGPQATASGDAP